MEPMSLPAYTPGIAWSNFTDAELRRWLERKRDEMNRTRGQLVAIGREHARARMEAQALEREMHQRGLASTAEGT